MNKTLSVFHLLFITFSLNAQTLKDSIDNLEQTFSNMVAQTEIIKDDIKKLKWKMYKNELKSIGLPSSNYLEYTTYFFEYKQCPSFA